MDIIQNVDIDIGVGYTRLNTTDLATFAAVMNRCNVDETTQACAFQIMESLVDNIAPTVLRAGLHYWMENHRVAMAGVKEMAGVQFKNGRTLVLTGEGVDWLDQCQMGTSLGHSMPCDRYIEVSAELSIKVYFNYTRDKRRLCLDDDLYDDGESDEDNDVVTTVRVFYDADMSYADLPVPLEVGEYGKHTETIAAQFLWLRRVLPTVRRICRAMRRCNKCAYALKRRYEPLYYDSRDAYACATCMVNCVAKRTRFV